VRTARGDEIPATLDPALFGRDSRPTSRMQDISELIRTTFRDMFQEEPRGLYLVGSHAEGAAERFSDLDIVLVSNRADLSKFDGPGFQFTKRINPGRVPPNATRWVPIGGAAKAGFLDVFLFTTLPNHPTGGRGSFLVFDMLNNQWTVMTR
jgi:hypothetical protein